MVERGNWPISSTEFGKFVYILVDFGNPTDADIA